MRFFIAAAITAACLLSSNPAQSAFCSDWFVTPACAAKGLKIAEARRADVATDVSARRQHTHRAQAPASSTEFCGDRYCPNGAAIGGTALIPSAPAASDRSGMSALVSRYAATMGISASIANALVRHESGHRANARGRAGEYGLTQIKCQTARGLGFSGACSQLLDPATNLYFGLKHAKIGIDKAGGDLCAGLSLHNRGLGARPVCTAYGRKVLAGR